MLRPRDEKIGTIKKACRGMMERNRLKRKKERIRKRRKKRSVFLWA